MTNSVKALVDAAKQLCDDRDKANFFEAGRHGITGSRVELETRFPEAYKLIHSTRDLISAVESEGDGWIEIKGMRDIPVGEDHLLLLGGEREGERVIGYWNRLTRGWMVNRVSDSDLVVTHYQPLPAPPTKEAR